MTHAGMLVLRIYVVSRVPAGSLYLSKATYSKGYGEASLYSVVFLLIL